MRLCRRSRSASKGVLQRPKWSKPLLADRDGSMVRFAGGSTCAFTKPGFWKSVVKPATDLLFPVQQVKILQKQNEENWVKVTRKSLKSIPLPDMLQLHSPKGEPFPEALLLVQTCDVNDDAGKIHSGLVFAFNVMHVARQVIVAACEAQMLADEMGSECPLPFVVMNPVTQNQFDKADLSTFNEAFVAGFRALQPADLSRKVMKYAATGLTYAAYAAFGLKLLGAHPETTGAFSDAFTLASGSIDVMTNMSAESLVDFTFYQSTVYGPKVPSMYWYAYNFVGRHLLASLLTYWKSRQQSPAQKGKVRKFDVRLALEINAVELARAAEMSLDESPVYNSETLDNIQHHCTQLRTTCSPRKLSRLHKLQGRHFRTNKHKHARARDHAT